jgi:cytochrome c peroxidase
LIGMNRLDSINDYRRDLEGWDYGRAEENPGHFTVFPLRGIWERPPTFLHNGIARTLRETVATPGHPSLRELKYEPLLGGEPERPNRREVGLNMTYLFKAPAMPLWAHLKSEARMAFDTHGGTMHLNEQEVDDLVNFMQTIE